MFKIAIVDDEIIFSEKLKKEIEELKIKYEVEFNIDTYKNGRDFLAQKEEKNYNLVFLDIEMEELSGLEVAEKIREKDDEIEIIFISSHKDYSMDLHQYKILDFIIKGNYKIERLKNRIEKALEILKKDETFFSFEKNGKKVQILCQDIYYFQSHKNKIVIYYYDHRNQNNSEEEYYGNIKELEKNLDNNKFQKINRSEIINLSKIAKIEKEEITLRNGTTLTISRGYKKKVNLWFYT